MTRSCLVTKKWYEPQRRQPWGVCYQLLCTDLGDEMSCILLLNHSIHGEEWCLSAMNKMSVEVKKCVGNAFFRDLEIQILKSPPFTAHLGGTSGDTDLANSKETRCLRKNGCKQKCLDNSLLCAYYKLYSIIIHGCGKQQKP